MCPDCGRQKMLFETEKQALDFLKYNGEDVNPDGSKEMKVYYCPACCGYHISSHEYKGHGTATDKLIERYRKEKDGSILDTFELFGKMVEQNFTTKGQVKRWLKAQDQYSEATKARAVEKYYKEGNFKNDR